MILVREIRSSVQLRKWVECSDCITLVYFSFVESSSGMTDNILSTCANLRFQFVTFRFWILTDTTQHTPTYFFSIDNIQLLKNKPCIETQHHEMNDGIWLVDQYSYQNQYHFQIYQKWIEMQCTKICLKNYYVNCANSFDNEIRITSTRPDSDLVIKCFYFLLYHDFYFRI